MGRPRLPGQPKRQKKNSGQKVPGESINFTNIGKMVSGNPDESTTFRVIGPYKPHFLTSRSGKNTKATPEEVQRWKDQFGKKINF